LAIRLNQLAPDRGGDIPGLSTQSSKASAPASISILAYWRELAAHPILMAKVILTTRQLRELVQEPRTRFYAVSAAMPCLDEIGASGKKIDRLTR